MVGKEKVLIADVSVSQASLYHRDDRHFIDVSRMQIEKSDFKI